MKNKWEYKNLKFSYDDIHETDFARVDFKELGLKGWELVSVTQFTPTPWDLGQGDSSIFTAFFKREIID